MKNLLTSWQAAKLLNVGPATIRQWVRRGKIWPAETEAGQHFFRPQDLEKLLEEQQLFTNGGTQKARRNHDHPA